MCDIETWGVIWEIWDRKLGQTKTKLLDHFDASRPLHSLTPVDGRAWQATLSKLSLATRRTHGGNAKTIFAEAVNRGLIPSNPLEVVEAGSTPSDSKRHVSREEIARVFAAAPGTEWPLMMGLTRYDVAEEGEEHLVTITGKGAVIRQMREICRRAKVKIWEKLWQTLRSSCSRLRSSRKRPEIAL